MKVDLSKLINRGEVIAVAVSGGADSMALLHYLKNAASGFSVVAANVEHGIRGESSVGDSRFVKEYCEKSGIKLYAFSGDSPALAEKEGISVEQAARKLRYGFFEKLLESGACDKIATAHHAGDNFETVLLNLFRGSSLKGVAGIKPIKGSVIRPLLGVSKAEILTYCKENGVPFVTDESNFDTEITRNFVRIKLVPEIKSIFPEAERAVGRFSEIAREEDEFLDSLADKLIVREKGNIKITLPADKVLLRRSAAVALKESGVKKDYESIHIESIAGLSALENGSSVSLPGGITAVKEYGFITVYKKNEEVFSTVPFALGEYRFPFGVLKVENADFPKDVKSGFFADADKIPSGAVIRTRLNGDVFTKFGGKTKKLKEYFIDEKIPQRLRGGLPLVALGNEILFAGNAISDKIKLDKSSVNVVKLTYTED